MTVSIIMPSYNCAPYVAAALQSAVLQTERDIEIILVDDGSTDATLTIAREHAARDGRIRVIAHEHVGTPSVARNVALQAASGEFITFLDADDLCAPTKIERELAIFTRHPELDVVFCDVAHFTSDEPQPNAVGILGETGFLRKAAAYMESSGDDLYLCKNNFYNFMSTQVTAVATQSVMIRRTALARESVWFRPDWAVGEDIDLWFRLARHSRLGYVDAVLAYYRQRPGSLMQSNERAIMGGIAAHETNFARGRDVLNPEETRMLAERLARQYFHLGYLRFTQGRMRDARAAYQRTRELDHRHYSALAYYKTFLPRIAVEWFRGSRKVHE